mmetsp:Transcript_32939/g.45978  ORF Transcript_32939/g.45978 Transcript_32939/m.45978 type:complete len:83 (+) Transcript_32939:276-524(+)
MQRAQLKCARKFQSGSQKQRALLAVETMMVRRRATATLILSARLREWCLTGVGLFAKRVEENLKEYRFFQPKTPYIQYVRRM